MKEDLLEGLARSVLRGVMTFALEYHSNATYDKQTPGVLIKSLPRRLVPNLLTHPDAITNESATR